MCKEVQSVLLQIKKKLERNNVQLVYTTANTIEDTFMAADTALKANVLYLSDTMKNAIISGISTIKFDICILAFYYYKTNEFEPTPAIVPTMRDVVSAALSKGVI